MLGFYPNPITCIAATDRKKEGESFGTNRMLTLKPVPVRRVALTTKEHPLTRERSTCYAANRTMSAGSTVSFQTLSLTWSKNGTFPIIPVSGEETKPLGRSDFRSKSLSAL